MNKTRSLEEAGINTSTKMSLKDGIGYAMGDAANLFILTYISSYLKVFFTDILHIRAERIATLLMIARVWDSVNDPLWGNIVAKKRPNKDGKFRPYIKWFAIPLGISAMLCFIDVTKYTSNAMLILVFAYVSYIFYGMMYTTINIPYGSLASVITDDSDGRTLLSTFRTIGAGLGGAVPLLIAPSFIYKNNEADANGFLMFGIVMGVLSIIFYYGCFYTTKERVPSAEEPKVDIKNTYIGMLKSRPFITAALSGILISGQLQFGSLNQYLYKNYFENTDLSAIGTVANYLPMAIMIFFMPKLVKKYGKQELCGFGTFFSALASILMFFVVPHCNRAGSGQVVFMIFLFVIGFGYSFVSITNWAIITDVIDYQEYKTGIRNESAVYAVYTFCRNLGQTIADTGGILLLGKFAGYDGEKMADLGYIAGVSDRILTVCTIIPAIVYTLVFILFKFGYPLNKQKLEPVYAYIKARETAGEEDLTRNPE